MSPFASAASTPARSLNSTADGGLRQDRRTDPARPGRLTVLPSFSVDHRLVDRAVIAAVEHQHLRPPGDGARHAQGKAVGIGGGGGDLPAEGAEAFGQQAPDLQRVFGRQHVGQAARAPVGGSPWPPARANGRTSTPVSPKAEIVDAVAVDIGEPRAFGLGHQHREAASASPSSSAAARRPSQRRPLPPVPPGSWAGRGSEALGLARRQGVPDGRGGRRRSRSGLLGIGSPRVDCDRYAAII